MKASEQCVHMILLFNHTVQGSLEMTFESVDNFMCNFHYMLLRKLFSSTVDSCKKTTSFQHQEAKGKSLTKKEVSRLGRGRPKLKFSLSLRFFSVHCIICLATATKIIPPSYIL